MPVETNRYTKHSFFALAPHPGGGLLVHRRVPVWVEQNQTVATDQVEATAACLAAEKEDELLGIWVVELVHHLLALLQ